MATIETKKRSSHINRQKRRANGRLVSTYSNSQLYTLVRQAAFKARPDNPAALSVREFDRTIGSLGYEDAPSARAIRSRLKRGWPDIVESAITPTETTDGKEVAATRSDEAHWLTERHLYFALNTVARFKGVKTLTAQDYDASLADYLDGRPQPSYILGKGARFPTSNQIIRLAEKLPANKGTTPWDRALIHVGLEPVVKGAAAVRALPLGEAINLYIEATGAQFYPSMNELERLRSECGISYNDRVLKTRKWNNMMEETLGARAAAGLPVPSKVATIADKPALALPSTTQAPKLRNPRNFWTDKSDDELLDKVVAYVVDCLIAHDPPVKVTKKHYQAFTKGKPNFPPHNELTRRKLWGAWIKAANERLLEQQKAA